MGKRAQALALGRKRAGAPFDQLPGAPEDHGEQQHANDGRFQQRQVTGRVTEIIQPPRLQILQVVPAADEAQRAEGERSQQVG